MYMYMYIPDPEDGENVRAGGLQTTGKPPEGVGLLTNNCVVHSLAPYRPSYWAGTSSFYTHTAAGTQYTHTLYKVYGL